MKALSSKVMAKVEVFVHAANADTDADISSPDIGPSSLRRESSQHSNSKV